MLAHQLLNYNFTSIDYSYKNPAAYVVLIPGLSLQIQNKYFTSIGNLGINDFNTSGMNYLKKFCVWHLRGTMAQCFISILACKILATTMPLFGLLLVFQLIYITKECAKRTIKIQLSETQSIYRSALSLI